VSRTTSITIIRLSAWSIAAMLATVIPSGCGLGEESPRPIMPVKVTVEPHIPGTLDLGVHLRLENLADEVVTVTVQIESELLGTESGGGKDLSLHPIFWGDGPVEVTINPKATLDFWFSNGQVAPEDPITVTHALYAAMLVRVPTESEPRTTEAIAIGPVE